MSYQGLRLIKGIGAQVKKTVTNRNGRLPQASDNAPIRGADMNDSRPFKKEVKSVSDNEEHLKKTSI